MLPSSLLVFAQGFPREVRFGCCNVPVGHLYVFFGKISIQNLSPFKNQILWTFFVSFFLFSFFFFFAVELYDFFMYFEY